MLIFKKNEIFLILIVLISIFSQFKSKKQKNGDVFLSLEKGFNCQDNIKNNSFIEINSQNEKIIFEKKIPFLLFITSSWCDYCCQEIKILSNVKNYLINSESRLINKIKIYQIQSDKNKNIIKNYKVFLSKIPSLYLVKSSEEIIQYSSYFKKKDIIYFLEKNISPIQELNTIEETEKFINNNKIKIKLIGFFIDKNDFLHEYSQFIKYATDINYRIDVETKICFKENISLYISQIYLEKINANYKNNNNFLILKRYDKIYYLDIASKGKYIKDFVYYNTFSPVEELSDNNKKIIMQLKTPIALFFIDTTYNINNYHKVLSYLEKLSLDFDLKYIFIYMDGGAKTDIKIKLGLDDDFPSLIIHHFDKNQGIKFPMKEQKFNDENIRNFLNNNLINKNYEKKEEKENKIKNNELLSKIKDIEFLYKNDYDNILFNKEKKSDFLLFIIDEYSFNPNEKYFGNKIKNIMDIIDEYGIDFYIDILWISKSDLLEYKNKIYNKNDAFKIKSIDYILNSKIIIKNTNFNKKDYFMKKYDIEIEKIKEFSFLTWLKDNIINKFEIPNKENYYEELYYKYKNISEKNIF